MNSKIEFLESVDIRRVWSKEDKNFTPWIADPSVMAKLLDQCGIDYDGELSIRQEVALPGYKRKLDVLVESTSGDKIAIENQFNEADHDHMTRALAYAVGLEAKAVIVVAEAFRPEFIDLANYLNSSALAYQEKGIPVFWLQLNSSSHRPVEPISHVLGWRRAQTNGKQQCFRGHITLEPSQTEMLHYLTSMIESSMKFAKQREYSRT